MPGRAWHPSDERTAAGNLTAFIEWLRATGRRPDSSPDDITAWRRQDSAAFQAALDTFAPGADFNVLFGGNENPDQSGC